MRHLFYHTNLGQDAVFHNFAIQSALIDLVTVFDAILTSRQMCEKLQCLFGSLMSNNFHKTVVLKKISIASDVTERLKTNGIAIKITRETTNYQ